MIRRRLFLAVLTERHRQIEHAQKPRRQTARTVHVRNGFDPVHMKIGNVQLSFGWARYVNRHFDITIFVLCVSRFGTVSVPFRFGNELRHTSARRYLQCSFRVCAFVPVAPHCNCLYLAVVSIHISRTLAYNCECTTKAENCGSNGFEWRREGGALCL